MRFENSGSNMAVAAVIAAAIASSFAFRTDRFGPHLGTDTFVPSGFTVHESPATTPAMERLVAAR